MGNYVPSLCHRRSRWSFRMCKLERCLMFCVYDVIVLIFVSFVLCCVPSCTFMFCFTFTCFCRACLCSPPSSGFSARLRVLIDPFIANWCTAFGQYFAYSSMCTPPSRGLSFIHQRVGCLHAGFRFTSKNSILNYLLSLGLCVYVLEFASRLDVGIVDVVCLSNR
jgi:hypothetical protein